MARESEQPYFSRAVHCAVSGVTIPKCKAVKRNFYFIRANAFIAAPAISVRKKNVFLYDIKTIDSVKHKQYTGVGNEQILSNLKKLFEVGVKIWVRIPIVPSVNDSVEEMQKIKDFLTECGFPEKIELLPYHPMGKSKSHALGKTQHTFEIPDLEKMKLLREIFK